MCRGSRGPCDMPEHCTGASGACPGDSRRGEGVECGGEGGLCYGGVCASRGARCRLLWGPAAVPGPQACYDGGPDRCGVLQCTTHGPPTLHYGLGGLATITSNRPPGGHTNCTSVILGLGGRGQDPGLVPPGATCAPGAWCVGQACVGIIISSHPSHYPTPPLYQFLTTPISPPSSLLHRAPPLPQRLHLYPPFLLLPPLAAPHHPPHHRLPPRHRSPPRQMSQKLSGSRGLLRAGLRAPQTWPGRRGPPAVAPRTRAQGVPPVVAQAAGAWEIGPGHHCSLCPVT